MGDKDGWRAVRRWPALPVVMAILGLTFSVGGLVGSAGAAGVPSGFGAIPSNGDLQSRCMSMKVAGHIVFPGDRVTAHTGSGICGTAPKDIGWSWSVAPGPGVTGCGANATTCSFRAGAATNGYTTICISGSSSAGGWGSCDYYGVPGKGVGIIDGTIIDKDGGPVAGATVTAYGKSSANTTTGSDGYYAMEVKAGSYRVLPSGGPHGKSASRYTPSVKDATVSDGASATAGFQLQAGVELELSLDKSRSCGRDPGRERDDHDDRVRQAASQRGCATRGDARRELRAGRQLGPACLDL